METKMLVEDNKGLEGFKKSLIRIATIFFAFIAVAGIGFYFFWKVSTAGAIILLAAILWFRRDEVKKKASIWLDIFRKRPIEVILFVIFLVVALIFISKGWPSYLLSFAVFVVLLFALRKDYEREQREERLSEKILMEKREDGYSA